MADWPGADELKQVLNVDSDAWDTTIERVLASAIDYVKTDVAGSVSAFDDSDPVIQITDGMAQAALRKAELIALRPDAATGTEGDPTYRRLIFGQRRRFTIA